jgi:nicotinamide-nucleotide amidase
MRVQSVGIVLAVASILAVVPRGAVFGNDKAPVDYVVVVTGGELLQGAFPDGHTFFIARTLRPLGLRCVGSICVDDRKADIDRALRFAVAQADLVIVTGGLGPTENDITRETLSSFTGIPLREDPDVLEHMERRFRTSRDRLRSNLRRQARVPVRGTYLKNAHGTAVGLVFEPEESVMVALPGPPRELEPMVREGLVPYLSRRFGTRMPGCSLTLRFVGLGQSQVDQTLKDHVSLPPGLTQSSQFEGGRVDFTFSLPDDTPAGRAQLEKLKEAILQHLGDHVYADDNESLESHVLRLVAKDGGAITLVEAGSGGSLAAALLGEGRDAKRLVAGALAAPRFEELRQLLDPLPRPWNPAASDAEKMTLLAEAGASRTGSLWAIAVGEVREDEAGNRYVDVVAKRRDAPVDHQRLKLRGSGEYARVRLITQLLDYLRRRLQP